MSEDLVLIPKAAERLGYSPKAIERKIERGIWREGLEWLRAPDGRRVIDMRAVLRWMASGGRA